MRNNKIIKTFLFICLYTSLAAYEHYFSICSMFKNEGRYLKEWIEYHRIHGCEHFYLYNNESDDDFLEVLAPYIKKGIVELIFCPKEEGTQKFVFTQIKAFQRTLKISRNQTKWLAFIDLDEFILPKQGLRVVDFLHKFDGMNHIGAIQINWQLFGTSNIYKLPENEPIIQNLVKKAPPFFSEGVSTNNREFKSIIRPECTANVNIHSQLLKPGYKYYPLDSQQNAKKPKFPNHLANKIKIDEICINHYFIRDEDFFINVKSKRKKNGWDNDYKKRWFELRDIANQVEDYEIHQWLPELKKRLASTEIID